MHKPLLVFLTLTHIRTENPAAIFQIKRLLSHVFLLAFILGVLHPLQSQAQIWAGIVDPSRAVDWSSTGVTGNIPNRPTICATLNPGTTISQINSAISNCPAGLAVFLSAGIYNLGSGMLQIAKNNVTVRGAGANQTKLYFTGRGNCGGIPSVLCLSGSWIQGGYNSTPQYLANWSAGYAKGSKVLTFSNTSGLSVGTRVILEQLNDSVDSNGVYVCGTGQKCAYTSHSGDNRDDRFQRQIVTVASVNGNQVIIDQPLHMPNWRSSQNPTARWASGTISGSGYENLSIDLLGANNTGGTQSNIGIIGAKDSWIKGIRSIMGDRSHIQVYQSVRITIRDNYFYGSYNGVQTSYGIESFGASSDLLVENNIFQHNTNPLIINDGGSGSVYSYNFSIDNYRSSPENLMVATFQIHSPGTGMILVEGNDGLAAAADNWYGTVHFLTYFRNHFYGDIYSNPPKSTQTQIMQTAAYSRFFNFIGNVLGRSGYYKTYESADAIGCGADYIWCWGYSHAAGGVTDVQTKPTTFRWGNFDTVTGASRFLASEVPFSLPQFANPVPASQALPASFYLTSKPSFFGNVPWPAIGPDVTSGNISGYAGHANKIPARLCWENSAIDSFYGNNNIREFEPDSCYANTPTPTLLPPTISNILIM